MSDYQIVKISNCERMRKNRVDSEHCNRRNRPHAYYKCFSYLQIPRVMKKFGYAYESEQPVMRQLRQGFQDKCRQYFSGTRVEKLGRRDKHERKERLDFQIKTHPVLAMFRKLNGRFVEPLLKHALVSIARVAEAAQ